MSEAGPEPSPATPGEHVTTEGASDGPAPRPEDLVRVVALDGPAGSGKSTVARAVAERLGWRFVDTGATYRAVTLAALRAGAAPDDPQQVLSVARRAVVELSTAPTDAFVRLDGEDVTAAVRGQDVDRAVSAVSAHPAVREVLIELQRRAMGTAGAVVEGRDIATVVAPHAAVKVYLDASPEARAARRAGQQAPATADETADREAVEAAVRAALQARDALDSQTNRLAASEGALHLDTTALSLGQVVDAVVELAFAAGLTPARADGRPQHDGPGR